MTEPEHALCHLWARHLPHLCCHHCLQTLSPCLPHRHHFSLQYLGSEAQPSFRVLHHVFSYWGIFQAFSFFLGCFLELIPLSFTKAVTGLSRQLMKKMSLQDFIAVSHGFSLGKSIPVQP